MQENLLAAGALPRTPIGELTPLPPIAGGEVPQNTPLSAFWASGFGPSGLAPDPK